VAASTGEGMEELKRELVTLSSEARKLLTANIPPARHDLIAFAHANAQIYEEEYLEDGTLRIVFAVDEKYHSKFSEFTI
jgi:50S ribosomal subunit-associated GTPase HflX